MADFRYFISNLDGDDNLVETEVTEEQYHATAFAAGFRIELSPGTGAVGEPKVREFERGFERAVPPSLETR